MTPLISNSILNSITRTLYPRGAKATFYKVTPADGEVEVGSVTQGFSIVREQRAAGRDGQGVKMLLSKDAGIDPSTLKVGAAVEITVNNVTLRYSIDELLPMQQIGAGYVLRLLPLTGATG